ncbi:Biofilm associated protein, partial [Acinetobacter baumannii]|uniref:hypothetical protein n=1 Tax=Acinetobacter baumannii TaxID=470 RepID=UPI002277F6C5
AIPVTGEGPVAIHAEAVDAQGNVDVEDANGTVSVDTGTADVVVEMTTAIELKGDGIVKAEELSTEGSFNAQVALGPDALDGTVVNVNGVNYRAKARRVAKGCRSPGTPDTGKSTVAIHAEAVDSQGNANVADADVTVSADTSPAAPIAANTIPAHLNGTRTPHSA